MQSLLPEYLEAVTIAGLVDGEEAYTVPWAMAADLERRVWIRADFEPAFAPRGTQKVKIVKVGGQVFVDGNTIPRHYRLSPSALPGDVKFLPVRLLGG